MIFVALRGHGDFPRAGNDHGNLDRAIFNGMGTLQLLNQLVQPLRNNAASNDNDHVEHEDGHKNHDGENVPSACDGSPSGELTSSLSEEVPRR